MDRLYPDARERILLVTDRQGMFEAVSGLANGTNKVDVAIDKDAPGGYLKIIESLPPDVKMLVFHRQEPDSSDFINIEGILASLRALHIKDLHERLASLSRLYELMTGAPPKHIYAIDDPREFAKQFIITLPPIRVHDRQELRRLNENLLLLIENA